MNPKLEQIVLPRVPPVLWQIYAVIVSFLTATRYNKNIYFITINAFITLIYFASNIFFELFTVSFEYTNNTFPKYENIGIQGIYISNKKYELKRKIPKFNEKMKQEEVKQDIEKGQKGQVIEQDNYSQIIPYLGLDNLLNLEKEKEKEIEIETKTEKEALNISNLKIDITVYIGDNNYIKYMLFYIYLFGITSRNFTSKVNIENIENNDYISQVENMVENMVENIIDKINLKNNLISYCDL